MIKTEYIVAAVVAVMWLKGRKKEASDTQLQDTLASQKGSDWIGSGGLYAMWERLQGTDLVAKNYPNIAPGAQADPGKIGLLSTNILPGWDGSIGAA